MNCRVVILKSQVFRSGGAEKYTWRIAKAFQGKGCDVTILTNGQTDGALPPLAIEIVRSPSHSLFSFQRTRDFDTFCSEQLKTIKADIVFGMDRNRFQTHLRASNGVHAAYLEHRKKHDSFFKRLSYPLNPLHQTLLQIEKQSFEDPSLQALFVNSSMVRKEILRYYSTDPQKIHVVHNGVEWNEMHQAFEPWQKRKRETLSALALPTDKFHFLFIGHNYARKGLEALLKGLHCLPNRDFHLSVIGKEKRMDRFAALTKQLGLNPHVSFFGKRSDILSFYQFADALVVPSFYDPFANVTVEALSMGVFVISSKTNGGHEVLTAENGAIIDSLEDPASIAHSLLVAQKHPKTEQQAEKIRSSVKHLDFSSQLGKLVELSLQR